MRIKNLPALVLAIGICEGVGISSSIFTFSAIPTWYVSLSKPFFSPPNFVFGPVWTILYLLMGVSGYVIWASKKSLLRERALKIFAVQLGLNFFWTLIFFGLRLPALAFIEIVVLWIFILATIIKFKAISKAAGYLLIPYILWVSFASLLNLAIVLLN